MSIQTEQEYNRYTIAYIDFEKSQAFLSEARKDSEKSLVYEALLFAAIVCYYRPFTANERGGSSPAKSKLDISEFGALTPSEQEIHKQCKRLRNKALTHSEFSFNPTRLHHDLGVTVSKPFSLLNERIDLEGLSKLLDKLIAVCHRKRGDYSLHKKS